MGLVKKSIIKRIAAWSGAFVLAIGIGGGVGYTVSDCGYSRDNYADDKQIEHLAEGLEADMSYMSSYRGDFYRLAHNDGEPIPVCFEEGYDARIKDIAIKSLDYAFGILQDINPLYSYKVVSNEEFKRSRVGTNGIKYSIKSQKELATMETIAQANTTSTNKKVNRIIKCEIFFSEERVQNSTDNEAFYSLLHEFMHLLGSEDVYLNYKENPQNIVYQNTMMKVVKNDDTYVHKCLSPNDYNAIMSIYSPKCVTDEELKDLLDVCLAKSKAYQDKYYKNVAEELKVAYSPLEFRDCGKIEEIKISNSYDIDGVPYADLSIVVKSGRFRTETSSDHGDFLNKDISEGKVLKYDNFIVLKQVQMERCYRYKNNLPYRGDFVLLVLKNTDHVFVFDLYHDFHGMFKMDELKLTHEIQPQSIISKRINKPIELKKINAYNQNTEKCFIQNENIELTV